MSSYGSSRTSRQAVRCLLVHLFVSETVSGFSLNTLTAFRTKAHQSKDVPGRNNCHKESESGVAVHAAQAPDMIRRVSAINMNYMSSGRHSTRSRMYDDDYYGSRSRWYGDHSMQRPVTGGGDIRSGYNNVRDMSWMGNGQSMFHEQANRYGYSGRRGRYEGMGNYGRGRYDYDDWRGNGRNRYDDGYVYDSRHDRGWGSGRYNNAYSSRRYDDDYRYDDRRYNRGRYNDRYSDRYGGYGYGGYGSRYMPDTGGGDIRQGANVKHISWAGNDDMRYLPGRSGSRRDVQIEHHLRNGALSEARALGWRD